MGIRITLLHQRWFYLLPTMISVTTIALILKGSFIESRLSQGRQILFLSFCMWKSLDLAWNYCLSFQNWRLSHIWDPSPCSWGVSIIGPTAFTKDCRLTSRKFPWTLSHQDLYGVDKYLRILGVALGKVAFDIELCNTQIRWNLRLLSNEALRISSSKTPERPW